MTIIEDIEAGLRAVAQLLVGLFFMLGGAAGVVWEKLHPPAHDAHLLAWAVVSLLGACVIPSIGPVLIKSLKGLVAIVLSVLPSRPTPPKDGA
jgi:hypothetical protein